MDEQEFKKKLNPERYRVMRQKGTENPFSGKYWENEERGIYHCAACGNKLFSSGEKFDARNGWPSFRKPIDGNAIEFGEDAEARCKRCGSHLGEIVVDGDKRHYRVNSIALDFKEAEELELELPDDDTGDEKDKEKDDSKETQKPRNQYSQLFKNISLVVIGAAFGGGAMAAVGALGGAPFMCTNTPQPAVATTTSVPTAQTLPSQTGTIKTPATNTSPSSATSSSGASVPATSAGSLGSPQSPASSSPGTP